jgi:hypothetical protein
MMRKTYTIQVTIELDHPTDSKMPLEVAERISSVIKNEWTEGGEDLWGYDGPMVVAAAVNVLD